MYVALWIYSIFLLLLGLIPAGRAIASRQEGREALSDSIAGFVGFLCVMLFLFRDVELEAMIVVCPLLLWIIVRDFLNIREELRLLREVANTDRQSAPYGSTMIALLGSYSVYYPAYFLGLLAVLNWR